MKKEAPDGLDLGERVRGEVCRKHQEGDGSAPVTFSLLERSSLSLGHAFSAEPPARIFPAEESRKGLAGGAYALDEYSLATQGMK